MCTFMGSKRKKKKQKWDEMTQKCLGYDGNAFIDFIVFYYERHLHIEYKSFNIAVVYLVQFIKRNYLHYLHFSLSRVFTFQHL